MKTIGLDVHKDWCQLTAMDDASGEVVLALKVRSDPEELQRVIGGLPGQKRVVMEEGTMSAWIADALDGAVEEVVSCDPTVNALIARAEDHNDENDAQRLITLCRAGALRAVYTPPEPYRTLRSLVRYDHGLTREITRTRNQIKGLCRRAAIRYHGIGVYHARNRDAVAERLPNEALRWEMESLYKRLDFLRIERVGAHRAQSRWARSLPETQRMQSVPGVGPIVARTLAAWVANPGRFKSRKALSAYGGLGVSQPVTHWQPTGKAAASRRGQREVKRVLFLAAAAAIQGDNALALRYQRRLDAGWERRKAIRDIARSILFIAVALWKHETEYQDELVHIPSQPGNA